VGDAGNAADTTGDGAVPYEYQIGKYEVTLGQYAAFLNAVAQTDPYSLWGRNMQNNSQVAGIARSGSSGSYSYVVIGPAGIAPMGASSPGSRPITHVTWFAAARFANWLHNGQPSGSQARGTTETGAYTLGGTGTVGSISPPRNVDARFWIPTENEWYKAAYFSPLLTSGSGGYLQYATQSDTPPGNLIGSGSNLANYKAGDLFAVTQVSNTESDQNYTTDVGAFLNSNSYFGTYDQTGNVTEWNDLDGGSSTVRGVRGGSFASNAGAASSGSRAELTVGPFEARGFRLAAPVPEPSTCAMALAGLACGGYSLFRRRRAC
jgi:formylglycine-generating enzyme required for sulfatase activity